MNGLGISTLYYFMKPYTLIYGAVLFVTLVASVFESLSLAAFFPVFTNILDETQEVGGFLGAINNLSELMPFSDPIVAASVLLICLFVLKTIFTLLREVLIAYASGKVLYDVKNRVMDRYSSAHYQYFLDTKQGTLIYNSQVAPHKVALLLLKGPQTVAHLLRVIALVVVLLFVSLYATLALAGVGILYFGAIHYLSKKVSYNLGKGRVEAGAEQNVIANEFITGIRQIVTFGTASRWLDRFRGQNRKFSTLYAKDQIWLAVPKNIMEMTAIVLMLGTILVLRSFNTDTFNQALPRLGVFAMALVQLLPSVTAVGRQRMEMVGALPDAELVKRTLIEPVLRRDDGQRNLESLQKAISFENVTFAYKGREPLLEGVNLTFEKGKVTAIVGPSGAGKTTLVNLILGLFEPTGGSINVDGIPVGEYKAESWLSKIGFVSQDSFIYHSTVAENIDFGRNGHSTESIVNAAEIANAHGFISELPQGYNTIVGDRGMKLSGGQQQRIAIARAVLDQPEILIFDEATSSLDSVSEKLVQEAIDNVSKEWTVIIIAHRLSTVRGADKIIVLNEGRVIEEGSHTELLERDGHYSRLVASST